MNTQRRSGVLVHPTSFPGKSGIGDLGRHAYSFIDFLEKADQTLWQVLPLNPTSFGDSPYQSFSTFAGNHYLVSPELLAKEGLLTFSDIMEHPQFDDRRIEYGTAIKHKISLLKKAYASFNKAESHALLGEFEAFCKAENSWLDDYALFVAIKFYFIEQREFEFETGEYKAFIKENEKILTADEANDYYYGAVWTSWPKDLAARESKAMESWRFKLEDEVRFFKFTQYLFFRQWLALKKYANERHIEIIGDIPIFVAYDSADVWANPKLFQLDDTGKPTSVAGVPPDYFSETGQLWGNPLYDWPAHRRTKYSWWISRVEATLKVCDIIRIDHFRGFESYWSIKYGEKTAVNGQWIKGPGAELFEAIRAKLGDLPIIAEDLGIITDEVTRLREGLGLPGMKVLQFGFDAGKNNLNMPHNFTSSNVVVYTGTHDNNTSLGWYREAEEPIRDQVRKYMSVSGDNVSWDMIRLAFSTVGIFTIVPIQDILYIGKTDRMNTPGIATDNWQFKYADHMLNDEMAAKLAYLSKLFDRNAYLEELRKPPEDEADEDEQEDEPAEKA